MRSDRRPAPPGSARASHRGPGGTSPGDRPRDLRPRLGGEAPVERPGGAGEERAGRPHRVADAEEEDALLLRPRHRRRL